MANTYGTCMACLDDLADPARILSGDEILIQDVYHLLTTQRGTMATKPEFGFGLSDELLLGRDPDSIPALASSIQSELEDDDRIDAADVSIEIGDNGEVSFDIQIDAASGSSFRLVGPLATLLEEILRG